MSILDEFRKLAHPYEDEDGEFDELEEEPRRDEFE